MSQVPTVVKIENLSKTFKVPTEASNGVKQKIINLVKGKKGYREFTPLNDISFEIKKGDFFGIVGRNGSGKSTLLKTIANIYSPSSGSVQVAGKLVPFIELGVGFNPELTGRENVFLNGALLGFSHSQMEKMYDEIVAFAELEDFMDERLKNYSSGMQVRLAFSIAIKAEGDILLLDEVLAVGDEAFQQKCNSYFNQLKKQKKTVILVTHDMAAVERFCNKAIMIEGGKISYRGEPHKVAARYSRANHLSNLNESQKKLSGDIKIRLLDESMKPTDTFEHNQIMKVKVSWPHKNIDIVGVAIYREDGQYIFGPNTYQDKFTKNNKNSLTYSVNLNLSKGKYFIKAGVGRGTDTEWVDFIDDGPIFTVQRDYKNGRWGGVSRLNYTWSNDE